MLPDLYPPDDVSQRWLHQLRLFWIALQFFTRLPIPLWVGFQPEWLQQSSRYFPAVGWVVGLITGLVYVLGVLMWPQPVAVLVSMAVGVYLTGAFHEDGFADMCDGFGGGLTKERVLKIMQDSRLGSYGVIGIVLLLATKGAALASLPPGTVVLALLTAHPVSRLAAVTLIWRLEYVRGEGKAKPLAQGMCGEDYFIAWASTLLPLLLLWWSSALPWKALLFALLAAFAVAWWLSRLFVRRIGGFTGDCLGAVQQLAEVACYLGIMTLITV